MALPLHRVKKNAAPPLVHVRFENPRLSRIGIEVLTLDWMRKTADPSMDLAQRVDFHHLLFIESGHGRHDVDFVEQTLRPHTLLLVRPGQVQRWHLKPGVTGQVLLVSGHALAPSIGRGPGELQLPALDEWPVRSRISPGLWRLAQADLARICSDVAQFEGHEVDAAILRHTLLALLLRLGRELEPPESGKPGSRALEIHRRFVRELEGCFHQRPSLSDCAQRIGYSESTVSRACKAVTGLTASQALNQRIAMEAKRLLVYSPTTVAHVGDQLGFSEPTNFIKFFKREVGVTPQAFREAASIAAR